MEARSKNLQTILDDVRNPLVALGEGLANGPIPFEISLAHLCNRINVSTRQVAGTQRW